MIRSLRTPRRRKSQGLSRRLLTLTLLGLVALIALAPASASASVNFEVKGQWLCNNQGIVTPLVGARVELWKNNTLWFDDKLGSTHTSSTGSYSFSVRSDENFDLYAQVVLNDDQGVNLGEWYSFSDWSTETETTGSHSGLVNLGTYEISREGGKGTPKCAVWQGAHNAYQNYKQVIGSPPPDKQYTIDADFPCCGVPFTTTDATHWPSNYPTGYRGDPDGGYSVNTHEFGHSVRQSLDGGTLHFLADVVRYSYLKNHEFCLVSNEGFAFNEGWAEFWAHTPDTCGDGTNFNQEGNVASALTGLEKCSNRQTMVRVLRESPEAIHSYSQFRAKWLSIVGPAACFIASLKSVEAAENTIAFAPLLASSEGQITAESQAISKMSRRMALVRTRALSPGRCIQGHCVAGIENLIQPSVLATKLAQAKLVRERLEAGLAAARSALTGPESAQLKFYETLDTERQAFERANQAILISGLKQSIATIKSKQGFSLARSTGAFHTMTERLASLTSARNRHALTPSGIGTLLSAPVDPTDVARHLGAGGA